VSQLRTLIWLKWRIFRNSLRSSKAVVNRIASVLGILVALTLSLLLAFGLGFVAYALTAPDFLFQTLQGKGPSESELPSAEFIFFSILAMTFLVWATVPLTMGSSRQFEPGNLLLYPISLRKLFAVDLVSEIVSIPSIFAIPSILAMGIGAGLGHGHLALGFVTAIVAVICGLALAKWIATSTASLFKKKRSRAEGLIALIGAVAGLGGVLFAQVAPMLSHRLQSISGLRWTPPGAIAIALTKGLRTGGTTDLLLSLATLALFTVGFIAITFWQVRRGVVGGGRVRSRKSQSTAVARDVYSGWSFPFASTQISAVLEKELRYLSRNAQLRMMAAMPLILIVMRLMNRRAFKSSTLETGQSGFVRELLVYGDGLIAATGVLYVFLILTGISCNLFAFESAGMRTLILSPISRARILLGKNIATAFLTALLCVALLIVNQIVFRDLTAGALVFATLCFLIYAPLMSVMGNSLSIRFPKRMKFGTRLNVSGTVGLLLIPIILLLTVPPIAAVAAGFIAQSLLVVYATLAVLAALAICLYLLVLGAQGDLLQEKEREILEVVTDAGND